MLKSWPLWRGDVVLDAVLAPDPLTVLQLEKAWRRAIDRDRKRYNTHIAALRSAIETKDHHIAAQALDWLLKSPSSKRTAIAQLLRAGKDLDVWTYHDVKALADAVTVFAPMDEPATVFAREKTSKRGFRAIFSFGDRQRVAQRVLANVVEVYTVKRSFQHFDAGVPKAIKRVLAQINAGNVWLAHLDIKSFYPSFTLKGLTDFLPLPNTVVEAALTGRNMVLECASSPYGISHIHFIEEARRGLPQGAATSPAISHLCVSQLALHVATLEHLFNYEDDFLILAKSKAELESRIEALTNAVGNLPGGQFDLSLKGMAHAADGLDFLGHRLFSRDGEAQAEPSVGNTMRLTKRLHEIDEKHGAFSAASGKIDKDAVAHSSADKLSLLTGWKAAFVSCNPSTEGWQSAISMEDEIVSELQKHGLSVSGLPKPCKTTSLKKRKFYYYKWFA